MAVKSGEGHVWRRASCPVLNAPCSPTLILADHPLRRQRHPLPPTPRSARMARQARGLDAQWRSGNAQLHARSPSRAPNLRRRSQDEDRYRRCPSRKAVAGESSSQIVRRRRLGCRQDVAVPLMKRRRKGRRGAQVARRPRLPRRA